MAESTKNMTVGAGSASASVTATVTDQMPGVPCPTSPGYEYTGMRYVPVFADPPEWSSANSYEPLEIVIHEGNSYTSKTFVPVGIDISNEDFWALTGNYNAQVEQYRQEVLAFDGRITKLEQQDTEIAVIGDSFSVYSYSNGAVVPNGNELWNKVEASTGYAIRNFAKGGAGWIDHDGTSNTFQSQLGRAISTLDPFKTKMVVVFGGVNDYSSFSSSASNIKFAIATFLNTYKNSPLNDVPVVYIANATPINRFNVIPVMLEWFMYASPNKASFATSFAWALKGKNAYADDYVHPNTLGYSLLSSLMVGVVENQNTCTSGTINANLATLPQGISISSYQCGKNQESFTVNANVVVQPTFTDEAVVTLMTLPNITGYAIQGIPFAYSSGDNEAAWKTAHPSFQLRNTDDSHNLELRMQIEFDKGHTAPSQPLNVYIHGTFPI